MPDTADLSRFPVLLFDMDGVITRTATIHSAAWKRLFDEFLATRDQPPFEIATDYKRYVDGRRRYDGVDGFLRSRGIELPWGDPADPPSDETVCGLGNKKNEYFADELERQKVEVFDDTVELIRAEKERGAKTAVVTASENGRSILENIGLLELFDAQMTGTEASQLELKGKPAPDTFVRAAEWLGSSPAEAVVFEDAISGVEAGRAGGFGLVVGVDRGGDADGLAAAGADVVSGDLTELIRR